LLTGPIIVACQWNCIARRQYMSNIAISLNNHKDGVIALTSARSQWVVSWVERTRSSPIGPAEHDEGGSLYKFARQLQILESKISCDRRQS